MNNMFNRIPPFKWFVLQNFPFIEEDFDAITNYQLLCKIVEYLNTTINKTNELGNQVEVLTNWFNNLDVQDEIDNKLDEMALDGTLAEIINEQIFTELNNQVETNTGDIADLKDADITLQGNIDTLTNNLEENRNPIDFYAGKNFVVFGDSFSQPSIPNSEDEYWVRQVAQATGMTRFNFAIAGAGFGRSTNLLSTQLTTAQNQMTATQKSNTAIVIIYAGYNDMLNNISEEDIESNFISLVTNTISTFPNAKIIVAPFNWGYGYLSRLQNITIDTLILRMQRDCANLPVVFLKLARYWLLGLHTCFRNSGHPNTLGYKTIASYMIGAIYGSSEHITIGARQGAPEHGTEIIREFTMKDGMVHFNFGIKFVEDLNDYTGEEFADLHALLCPETDIFIPLYSTAGFVGTLILKNNATAYLQHVTTTADTWCLGEVTFPAQAWKTFPRKLKRVQLHSFLCKLNNCIIK